MPLGQTPYVYQGGQEDLKRLFYSDPNRALAKAITIPAGYGVIKAGTVMGIITESTSRKNYYVPYVFADTTGLIAALSEDNARGLAYLVADQGGSSEDAYVVMDDSYKFAVGDHLQAQDSDYATQTDCGAITAIDRTTYLHMAKITVTNTIGVIQTSKGASISIQTAAASPYVKGVGILKAAVDTGTGENAKGAQGVLVLKNAMLYKDNLYCYNAEKSKDCVDCLFVFENESCYECIQCENCYNTKFALHSKNCSDSWFLEDCIGCRNCAFCFNLHNKEYCILNKQYSKEDYFNELSGYQLDTHSGLQKATHQWIEEKPKYIKRAHHNLMSEDCTGEYIFQSKPSGIQCCHGSIHHDSLSW